MGAVELEDFSAAHTPASVAEPSNPEGLREAFERGYRSGWDDARSALQKETETLSAELAQNLSDISFGFHEAREDVLSGMRRFLAQMLDSFLPSLTDVALKESLLDALDSTAARGAPRHAIIAVSPDDAPGVTRVLPAQTGLDVTVVGEPALISGQAQLSLAGGETEFDFAEIRCRLEACLEAHRDNQTDADARG